MVTVEIPQFRQSSKINRIIGTCPTGEQEGPLVIAIGGIHGNEPSGVFAIENVLKQLRESEIPVHGKFVGIAGNLPALAANQRYIDEDLNRLFLERKIEAMETSTDLSSEEKELKQILELTDKLAKNHEEIYFIDCHTTSSPTIPYISVNEYEESLTLAEKYPLFSVIGLEKSIPGCLAEYFNERGFHGFTFEAGQHHNITSVRNHEAAIALFLVYTGLISEDELDDFDHHYARMLNSVDGGRQHFHVVEHYRIKQNEVFKMKPGYTNFQQVEHGEVLATNQKRVIRSDHDGRILMPLYQSQGDDGYFILQACG